MKRQRPKAPRQRPLRRRRKRQRPRLLRRLRPRLRPRRPRLPCGGGNDHGHDNRGGLKRHRRPRPQPRPRPKRRQRLLRWRRACGRSRTRRGDLHGAGQRDGAGAVEAPNWVKVSPFVAMLIGFVTAWVFYIKDPSIPAVPAAQQPILYRFLLNKWYFDELYDVIFVRPARWLGNFLWEARRRQCHRRDDQRRGAWRGTVLHPTRRARPVGLPVPLRIRDGHRYRGASLLDDALGGAH